MKYSGTFEDLENIVKTAGIKIKESKSLSLNSSGGYQIRTSNGGIINWYGSTGTLQIQGKDLAAKKLKEDLTPYLRETSTTPSPIALSNIPKTSSNISESPSKKIFIAHGHDHTALEQLETLDDDAYLAGAKDYIQNNLGKPQTSQSRFNFSTSHYVQRVIGGLNR